MKSLAKIIRRYTLTAGLILVIILMVNLGVLTVLGYAGLKKTDQNPFFVSSMRKITHEMTVTDQGPALSQAGYQTLKQSAFLWAMALDEKGKIAWEWQLPHTLLRSYSLQDVAVFSRWYLQDYPVKVQKYDRYLLVFGSAKDSWAKYNMEFSISKLRSLPRLALLFLLINLLLILLFVLGFGYRFYHSLLPIGNGIEKLSNQQPVTLKEKGLIAGLAQEINRTSAILEKQNRRLQQRDQARTEWISGVSHDIRTPLTLIMGYADALSASPNLSPAQQQKASAVFRQSLIIRRLVEDLNLTSKLTYQAQPLHREDFSPALLLRECAAEFYNNGLKEIYDIQVIIPKEAEQIRLNGDTGLWLRALRNLLGNSIRHNPAGCRIQAILTQKKKRIWYEIRDSGTGIPEEIVQLLNQNSAALPPGAPHIMGLHLTKQIAKAHGGGLWFQKRESGTYDAVLVLSSMVSVGR